MVLRLPVPAGDDAAPDGDGTAASGCGRRPEGDEGRSDPLCHCPRSDLDYPSRKQQLFDACHQQSLSGGTHPASAVRQGVEAGDGRTTTGMASFPPPCSSRTDPGSTPAGQPFPHGLCVSGRRGRRGAVCRGLSCKESLAYAHDEGTSGTTGQSLLLFAERRAVRQEAGTALRENSRSFLSL